MTSTRRSNRLQDLMDQKTSDAAQAVPTQHDTGTKRKIPTTQETIKTTGIPKRAKKSETIAKAEGPGVQNLDRLSSLSPEIWSMITENITQHSTISALMRTSKRFYTLMAPRLYNRIAAAAMFHSHIAKLIRTLEPHLTIKQKKQLKKEGEYKGQRDKYPTGLDEKQIPVCAGHVRQLVMGVSDPGKKHKYIVLRYFEEILKNMKNLDIVETSIVNKSICKGIASLASLKALSIYAYNAEPGDISPLAHIADLKHLRFELEYDLLTTGQSLIRNSRSTLQSLQMITSFGYHHIFHDWEQNLRSDGDDAASTIENEPDFSVLKSLLIEGMMIDEEFIKVFQRAIPFPKLRELSFSHLRDSETLLWPCLTNLVTSCTRSGTPLDLRTLSIDMYDSEWEFKPEQLEAQFAAKCPFIASFDTLTTLKLPGYGQYRSEQGLSNPGFPDTLLQAILKHQNLRVLEISYGGIISGMAIPYLAAKTVGDIIDGLPQLREFEFAPDESQMDEISQALCRGKSLEAVICYPHESWGTSSGSDSLGMNILSSVLSIFMSNANVDAGHERFVWEDHYRLNRLDLKHTGWHIASKFGKTQKGQKKAEKFQVSVGDDRREVHHQVLPRTTYIHVGYDPLFEWITNVEKDI